MVWLCPPQALSGNGNRPATAHKPNLRFATNKGIAMPSKSTSKNPQITGRTASLTWQGKRAPLVISDLHGWEENPQPMTRTGPDLWQFDFELDEDTYLEYALLNPVSGERLRDPRNPRRTYNGMGAYNHYFYMPGARPSPLTRAPKGGLRGKIARHTIPVEHVITTKKRRIYLYQPPVREAVPLLAVYDGMDYFKRGKLTEIVDNLILQKRIRPIALAFLQNAGAARVVEYACADTTLAFLTEYVLPLAAKEINLSDHKKQPGVHGILGASMGGLMSVYTSLRLPHIFGRAMSQAGCFVFVLPGFETVVMDLVHHAPRPDIKLWLDCGKNDFLRETNRQISDLLTEKGYDFTYRENGGAHNYNTWRDNLATGLEALFGES
jgi:enterochelin esterase family protein